MAVAQGLQRGHRTDAQAVVIPVDPVEGQSLKRDRHAFIGVARRGIQLAAARKPDGIVLIALLQFQRLLDGVGS